MIRNTIVEHEPEINRIKVKKFISQFSFNIERGALCMEKFLLSFHEKRFTSRNFSYMKNVTIFKSKRIVIWMVLTFVV